MNGHALTGLVNQGQAFTLKIALRMVQQIVAHPDLKQVAQDEQGVGSDLREVARPSLEIGRFAALQVDVRNELDAGPMPRIDLAEFSHGGAQSKTALLMTTSSLGTSS